jgi:hypothetical protein
MMETPLSLHRRLLEKGVEKGVRGARVCETALCVLSVLYGPGAVAGCIVSKTSSVISKEAEDQPQMRQW